MRLLAIADPHLSSVSPKPMDIFGGNWRGHPASFFEQWRNTVLEDDVVIVAGDISWGLHLADALPDLRAIADLPGEKIILRGNHDYWWGSIGKVRSSLPPRMHAIQNDSLVIGRTAILGSRGWTSPGAEDFGEDDEKIYHRELERLRLGVKSLEGKKYDRLVLALHFPPTNGLFEENGFTKVIDELQPDAVIYGHLHGVSPNRVLREWNGIPLHFVAADAVNFKPQVILETL